jgi:hypothetical protein
MPVSFDATISGYGEDAVSPEGQVAYGTSRLVTLGAGVSRYNPPDGTHLYGLGWLSIGFSSDDGSGDKYYFVQPVVLSLSQQLLQFGVRTVDDPPIRWGQYASRIRWWIAPGSSVHIWLYVFDT